MRKIKCGKIIFHEVITEKIKKCSITLVMRLCHDIAAFTQVYARFTHCLRDVYARFTQRHGNQLGDLAHLDDDLVRF